MAITNTKYIESAYKHAEKLAQSHYENFPVASRFLPKKIRRPIAVIYAFARQADDIADEGNRDPLERLDQLEQYVQSLEAVRLDHLPKEPVFIALKDVFNNHPLLPIQLLFDLLTAFKQDVVKSTYKNFEELLAYCQYSANPIGRLLLHLTDNASPKNLAYSDNICTALQLINFLQDLKSDLLIRKRRYLPEDELQTSSYDAVIHSQLLRAESLLEKGSPLGKNLNGLFGFEIRLIINAGRIMIKCLKKRKYKDERPILRFWHWPKVLLTSLK